MANRQFLFSIALVLNAGCNWAEYHVCNKYGSECHYVAKFDDRESCEWHRERASWLCDIDSAGAVEGKLPAGAKVTCTKGDNSIATSKCL